MEEVVREISHFDFFSLTPCSVNVYLFSYFFCPFSRQSSNVSGARSVFSIVDKNQNSIPLYYRHFMCRPIQ